MLALVVRYVCLYVTQLCMPYSMPMVFPHDQTYIYVLYKLQLLTTTGLPSATVDRKKTPQVALTMWLYGWHLFWC